MRITIILSALLCSLAFSDNGPELTSLFSAANNPGSGILELKMGDKTEKIVLGKETGYYGLGMVFSGQGLPDPYRSDFKDREVIQVALGSVRAPDTGKIPQFGAATLVSPKLTVGKLLTFPFNVTENKKTKKYSFDNMGILLFTSPSTPKDQTDEEKLKVTFFAAEGSLNLLPLNTPKLFTAKSQTGDVKFSERKVKIQFKAGLGTPFSEAVGALEGVIEIPVYTPAGKAAEKLASDIASKSLNLQARSTATKK